MPEKPFEPLLHRELHTHDVETHFPHQLNLVRDVVNYGTNLVPSCFISSKRSLGDVVAITVFLKQVVMMLDAFEVLISKACVAPSILQTRALHEASLYLDWLLLSDQDEKALYYYVANIRAERQWARRGIADDVEQERFFRDLGDFADAMEPTRQRLIAIAPERLRQIEQLLSAEPYAKVNAAFDKARGHRRRDVAWYVPLGINSIRSIAKAVERLHEYEVFYAYNSELMHTSRHDFHVKIHKGQIELEPLRHLENLATTLRFTVGMALHAYRQVLTRYRPSQLNEFSSRYLREWRDAYMAIPHVHYQRSPNPTAL